MPWNTWAVAANPLFQKGGEWEQEPMGSCSLPSQCLTKWVYTRRGTWVCSSMWLLVIHEAWMAVSSSCCPQEGSILPPPSEERNVFKRLASLFNSIPQHKIPLFNWIKRERKLNKSSHSTGKHEALIAVITWPGFLKGDLWRGIIDTGMLNVHWNENIYASCFICSRLPTWSVITIFLSFFGLQGKMALPVLKNFWSFLDFCVHKNPDFSSIAGIPNSLTCLFLQSQVNQPTFWL